MERYLDSASRLGEVLFGLIMVLGATLTAGLSIGDGDTGARRLLQAALGCNIAWGIIDAIMYVMNCMTERAEKARLIEAIQRTPDRERALDIIRTDIEPRLEALSDPADRDVFCRSILTYLTNSDAPKITVTRDDLYGAIACFWLVVLACLPASTPFLLFAEPIRALRVSNALLIAMLFLVGHKWGRLVHTNPLLAGVAMVAIGLALVGVAILLGG
ncbi:MAG TPA: VIT family protein [Candidatus Binatia bacterium]|nr:VIT family protein [Candidatus Binatia bacterium]